MQVSLLVKSLNKREVGGEGRGNGCGGVEGERI